MATTRTAAPNTPRPSATIVLLREADAGPESLLVLRHARSVFGSTYVFPGGVLEDDDLAVAERCLGIAANDADALLGERGTGIAYFSAAIRELFEEAGVLLARDASGAWVQTGNLGGEREALNAGTRSWSGFLADHDLYPAADALHYFSYWITPRAMSKRFATRFFAARLPDGQVASHCGIELTDSAWITPAKALWRNECGAFDLPHPTLRTLRSLADFTDVPAALKWAGEQGRAGVTPILPVIVEQDGERRALVPGDPDYPSGGGEY